MPTSAQVKAQIDQVLAWMIEVGLSDDQNGAFLRELHGEIVEVTFRGAEHISVAMRDYTYQDIHARLLAARAYSARLADGSLLQMTYRFAGRSIQQHRLAFFPTPDPREFANNAESLGEDDVYAELQRRNVVPVPLRFDYDRASASELSHPASHLTIGQYPNCRIPVSAPLVPVVFVEFVARNFYHTAFTRHEAGFPARSEGFEESILPREQDVLHVVVPDTTR